MGGIRYLADAETRTPAPYVAPPPAANPTVIDAQGGSFSSASGTRTVVFPRSFASTPQAITAYPSTGGAGRAFQISSRSPSGFTISDINSDNITIFWSAELFG